MKREALMEILNGGLWHTNPDRFQKILERGALLPEPDLPNAERWFTGSGPKHYPYVRHLGGVSLFEFAGFDPKLYLSANL